MDILKRTAIGITAHVDSGKTTLSESILFTCGNIRKCGRVDYRNSFLDNDEMERERGITIFSKQAVIKRGNVKITLLDTPGHVDFAAETERALWALDAVVLVVSATDGVQSHTKTLWKMLEKNRIPTFIFINKTDIAKKTKEELLCEVRRELSENIADVSSPSFYEDAAVCAEEMMNMFLESGTIEDEALAAAFGERKLFPCVFGSALKNEGVDTLIEKLCLFSPCHVACGGDMSARVFKITQDERGQRLTHMKITHGSLTVRESLNTGKRNEKVNDIRIYSGERFDSVTTAFAGDVCAVCGFEDTYAGQGINEENAPALFSQPIFTYSLAIKDDTDPRVALAQLKKLEQEETRLCVSYEPRLDKIQLRLMGEIQLEIICRTMLDRFGIRAELEPAGVLYKETIAAPTEGVGHFEPLRHYAEVHLLLEPLPRGSGTVYACDCPQEILSQNWQRLIMTHLKEREHRGVLTGAPITDIKITLKSGKAHQKHTEGGDFRQATYRAVRQGLRSAQSILLEPYYNFMLTVPTESVGRAMTDLNQMGAELNPPENNGEASVIKGRAPAKKIGHYQRNVTAYTKGVGKLALENGGYEECKEADEVIKSTAYDCDADLENTADSVFCTHGTGCTVAWNEVKDRMHLESIFAKKEVEPTTRQRQIKKRSCTDEELMEIFERTYGKIERKLPERLKTPKGVNPPKKTAQTAKKREGKYLLVDGYNILYAQNRNQAEDIAAARDELTEAVGDYILFHPCEAIVVFDAYRVKGDVRQIEKRRGVSIVYTKEAETADSYIERVSNELGKKHYVSVATSDAPEQLIIFGNGAQRIPARDFIKMLEDNQKEIAELVKRHNAAESTE